MGGVACNEVQAKGGAPPFFMATGRMIATGRHSAKRKPPGLSDGLPFFILPSACRLECIHEARRCSCMPDGKFGRLQQFLLCGELTSRQFGK